MTATLTGPRTILRLHNWATITDDDRRTRRFVTLEREDECLVVTYLHWQFVTQFAHAVGEWRPAGTDSGHSLLESSGRPASLPAGSYFPLGQTVDAADANRLAQGITRGMERLPSLIGNTDQPQQWPVDDRRLWPTYETPDVVRLADMYALDVNLNVDRFVDFFSRGAFRITSGLPIEMAPESSRQKEVREKRDALEVERRRLVTAVQRGTITDTEAAPLLATIRASLEHLNGDN